ncbi:MAG: hypothetical protein JNM58_17940 [Xanthomonadaceae bacterium]|nr:hypothetical protein [Xanthomonadaceae bacterium]
MSDQDRPAASALDAIIPTNPLAALSCWIGIGSVVLCGFGVLLGPIAIVLGWLGLKKWKMQESNYGATTSKVRAWIGISTGILGIVISAVFWGMTVFNGV